MQHRVFGMRHQVFARVHRELEKAHPLFAKRLRHPAMPHSLDRMRQPVDMERRWFDAMRRPVFLKCLCVLSMRLPEMKKALLTDRNQNWVGQIEKMLTEKKVFFITVGAGHLAGPDGVPALLREAGYRVEGP